MINQIAIDALESCKKVLVEEIRKYLAALPAKEVKCWVHLPVYTDDTYGLDGYWTQNTVTSLRLDRRNNVIVQYEDYDEQYKDGIEDCFTVGEIAKIIDCLP